MIKVKISTQLMGHFVKLGMNRADIGIWKIPYELWNLLRKEMFTMTAAQVLNM